MTTVICAGKRTPIGRFQGIYQNTTAPTLASAALQATLTEAELAPEHINQVILGCVLSAGLGQAPARQAALDTGIPEAVGAYSINKVCGSGLLSLILGHQQIQLDPQQIILAGGMENMSRAPHLLANSRRGTRLGTTALDDHMLLDGLTDATLSECPLMGVLAEQCAEKYQLDRSTQDAFSLDSLTKAQVAQQNGFFAAEICPFGEHQHDETLTSAKPDKLPQLKPAFKPDGTITAGNASGIADGACSLLMMSLEQAKQRNLNPLAQLVGHTSVAQAPCWFTTAPIQAIETLLAQLNWRKDSVNLFEINEAFAVVPLAAIQALELDANKINHNGGACALGHPIGMSGSRLVLTLIHALHQTGGKRGIATACIGGGEAIAIAVETL